MMVPSFPPLQFTSVLEVEKVIPEDLIMVTVSLDGVHVPLLIVHTNVFVPTDKPVIPDVGLPGVVTALPPAITVHVPVPTVGALPARLAVEEHAV